MSRHPRRDEPTGTDALCDEAARDGTTRHETSRDDVTVVLGTTSPGIEDVARDEGTALLERGGVAVVASQVRGLDRPGVVTWEIQTIDPDGSGDADAQAANRILRERVGAALGCARSLYHVVVHLAELAWDGTTIESLVSAVDKVPLDDMASATSFRASCTRVGEHAFHSPDVERAVGTAIQSRYGTAVDLEGYDLNVRVDITGRRAFCGYQLTGRKGLDRRYPWQYHPRVTLRTTVAYALLVLSGYPDAPGALHDPFCGSGTILLEALSVAREGDHECRVSGSDWDQVAVHGAKRNLVAAGFPGTDVFLSDARSVSEVMAAGSLDFIITNPPFGIRLGSHADFRGLYDAFLREAARLLRPGGTLTILVGKRRGTFNRVLRGRVEYALSHVRVIEIGGVFPAIFVLKRTTAASA